MADIKFEENDLDTTTTLEEVVEPENNLKEMLVNYVGEQHNPEDDNITVHMIVETLAKEFPEFVLAVAEENFLRGYQQALHDVDSGYPADLQNILQRTPAGTQSEEQK
tara:strand:+ start:244 stop:567 length:324 start_codon:yes stop_codon:yes gene_type:complete